MIFLEADDRPFELLPDPESLRVGERVEVAKPVVVSETCVVPLVTEVGLPFTVVRAVTTPTDVVLWTRADVTVVAFVTEDDEGIEVVELSSLLDEDSEVSDAEDDGADVSEGLGEALVAEGVVFGVVVVCGVVVGVGVGVGVVGVGDADVSEGDAVVGEADGLVSAVLELEPSEEPVDSPAEAESCLFPNIISSPSSNADTAITMATTSSSRLALHLENLMVCVCFVDFIRMDG